MEFLKEKWIFLNVNIMILIFYDASFFGPHLSEEVFLDN